MACLNNAGIRRAFGRGHSCDTSKKPPDRNRIGGIISALVNHFETIVRTEQSRRDLNPAGSPAARQRHFTRTKRHLITRNGDSLQQSASDHPFGLFIEITKIIILVMRGERKSRDSHSAASFCCAKAACSALILRRSSNSP